MPTTYIDGLVWDCSNSSALAMELLQSCTKPLICSSANIVITSLFSLPLCNMMTLLEMINKVAAFDLYKLQYCVDLHHCSFCWIPRENAHLHVLLSFPSEKWYINWRVSLLKKLNHWNHCISYEAMGFWMCDKIKYVAAYTVTPSLNGWAYTQNDPSPGWFHREPFFRPRLEGDLWAGQDGSEATSLMAQYYWRHTHGSRIEILMENWEAVFMT